MNRDQGFFLFGSVFTLGVQVVLVFIFGWPV